MLRGEHNVSARRPLAFVSLDPITDRDARQSSYYVFEALRRQWEGPVVAIDGLLMQGVGRYWAAARKLCNRALRGVETPVFASALALRHYAAAVERAVGQLQPSVIVAKQPFILGRVHIPPGVRVLLHTDATTRGLERIGGYMDGWDRHSIQRLIDAETRAVLSAHAVTVTSRWVADDYVNSYGVDASRIRVLPIGASFDAEWRLRPEEMSGKRGTDILFWGGDWDRKGGDIARKVVEKLRASGRSTRLIVVGPKANPAPGVSGIMFIERFDKASVTGAALVRAAMLRCAFLLLPTRSDCSPAVVAEAAALGLPALTSDVGGLVDTVLPGVTGYCLPLDAPLEAWCKASLELLDDAGAGWAFGRAALSRYDESMNWDSIVVAMLGALDRSHGKLPGEGAHE